MLARKGEAWVVESGKVRVGDTLTQRVRNEIVIDAPLCTELSKYDVYTLRKMGYRILRPCASKKAELLTTAHNSARAK